jgi:hypothetical protein
MNVIRDAIDAGPGPGLLRLYTGPRPATGGAVTTLLAELTFSDPSYAAASSGSITANAINSDPSANATGTAAWARVVDSTGQFVFDCDVGTSGSDINLNSTSIATGLAVEITSSILTDGNA